MPLSRINDNQTVPSDDVLRADAGTRFKLVQRTVHLAQSVVLAKNLGLFF